ncbi:cilia- and flagella-associated protein 68 isoform X1 [Narcine bancroftii]|uniref:cilia- and flagella-associated protein 68 isoform X1 n=1 Tax=Narcine bancroftii TaxID=1343680 RepID=UPI0038322006
MSAARRPWLLRHSELCPVPRSLIAAPRDGENRYGVRTLLAQWFEERNGRDELRKRKPLPSQYEHAYRTIYADSYGKPEIQHRIFKSEPHVYPGHQPELNPPNTKVIPQTTYMLDYIDPVLQMNPPPRCDLDRVEKKELEYCGSPVLPDMDTDAEKHQICISCIPLEPCSPTNLATVEDRQSEELRFCGSCVPTKGPFGQCTAEFCKPCTPAGIPSRPGLAVCYGSIIP